MYFSQGIVLLGLVHAFADVTVPALGMPSIPPIQISSTRQSNTMNCKDSDECCWILFVAFMISESTTWVSTQPLDIPVLSTRASAIGPVSNPYGVQYWCRDTRLNRPADEVMQLGPWAFYCTVPREKVDIENIRRIRGDVDSVGRCVDVNETEEDRDRRRGVYVKRGWTTCMDKAVPHDTISQSPWRVVRMYQAIVKGLNDPLVPNRHQVGTPSRPRRRDTLPDMSLAVLKDGEVVSEIHAHRADKLVDAGMFTDDGDYTVRACVHSDWHSVGDYIDFTMRSAEV